MSEMHCEGIDSRAHMFSIVEPVNILTLVIKEYVSQTESKIHHSSSCLFNIFQPFQWPLFILLKYTFYFLILMINQLAFSILCTVNA